MIFLLDVQVSSARPSSMKLSVPNMMKPAVQILESFFDETEAQRFYNNVTFQEGVTHVRLLRPSASKPGYRVQALMVGEDMPAHACPDGMRRVSVSDSILSHFDVVPYRETRG